VTSVAFSPDGKHIASGSYDNTVRVWDADTGRIVSGPFTGHDDRITSVAFSPDGKHVASSSHDKTVRVWDIQSSQIVSEFFAGRDGEFRSVTLSPEKIPVITGSSTDNATTALPLSQSNEDSSSFFPHKSSPVNHQPMRSSNVNIWTKLEHGWVYGPQSELLFWVPPDNRAGLHWPSNILVIGPPPTRLNLQNFACGSNWTSCHTSDD
jgi:WD40 repeat protein